jgi:hypothetical protein
MAVPIVFFGVWSATQLGHHFYSPQGLMMDSYGPFTTAEFDQGFENGGLPLFYFNDRREPEEPLTLTQYSRNGQPFTIVGCWDRSADNRSGAKAAFISEGFKDKATMVKMIREHFPTIADRLKTFTVGAERGWEGQPNQR